jgi:hypothetical protein
MAHDTSASMPNNLEVKSTFLSPKKKNRNGFAGKRITEFDHTLGVKLCQRESTYFDAIAATSFVPARKFTAA